MQARKDLNEIARVLGMIDYPLVCRIVGGGTTVEIEARTGHWGTDRPERYVARRVRDALATLADHRGAKGKERSTIRSWREVPPEMPEEEGE